jgi:hypothetical protein
MYYDLITLRITRMIRMTAVQDTVAVPSKHLDDLYTVRGRDG